MQIFGEEATPSAAHIRKLVQRNAKGKQAVPSPKRVGRPKSLPDEVTGKIIQFESLLRSYSIPVFRCTVIAHLMRLVEGTGMHAKFLDSEGDWDQHKLNHWYDRRLKGDHKEVRSGKQRPLDIARSEWEKEDAVSPFYDHTRDMLIKAGIAYLNPRCPRRYP